MAQLITVDGYLTLEDLVREGLDVLFVGYNPNPLAVAEQHYYARKANRFWEDLHESGFVPKVLRGPGEDRLVLDHDLGITDVVKRPTPNIDGLTAAELRLGFVRLAGLLRRYRPRIVCFNGLGLARGFRRYGQPLPDVLMHQVPSTSPRNNGRRQERLEAFCRLKALVDALKREEALTSSDKNPAPAAPHRARS